MKYEEIFGDGSDGVLENTGQVITATRDLNLMTAEPGAQLRPNGFRIRIHDMGQVSFTQSDDGILTFHKPGLSDKEKLDT